MACLPINIQFLNDTDPFSSTLYLEPRQPLTYTFSLYIPLAEQLPAVQKLLRAPQKVINNPKASFLKRKIVFFLAAFRN